MEKNWFVNPMPSEVPQDEIMDRGDSGEFHSWDYEAFDTKENGYEDLMDTLKNYQKVYAKAKDKGDEKRQKEIVEEVLKIYRDRDVFPIQYYSENGVIEEIEKCLAYKASFDGDTVSCVSGDTEFFNGYKWKRIDEYTPGEKVLQFNPDGTSELVFPTRYISEEGTFRAYIYNDCAMKSRQTADHNCVLMSCKSVDTLPDGADIMCDYEYGMLYKATQENVVKFEDYPLKVPASTLYRGNSTYLNPSILEIEQIVRNCEFCNYVYDDSLLSMSYEKRVKMLMVIMSISGVKREGYSYYVYYSEEGRNLEFVASLVFMLGMRITYMDEGEVRFAPSGFYTEIIRNSYTEGIITSKYCFEVPSHMLVLRYQGIPYITGNCGAGVGTTLCDYLFPNLYDTPSKHDVNKVGAETLYAKFYNDAFLRRAIEFCFSYKDGRPVPTSVMGGLRLVGSAPTNFRPMNAKAVYERFCPKEGVIYDYCCVDGETEFFNGYHWKKIKDYVEGDMVLQYEGGDTGSASLVEPIEYIKYRSNAPFHLYKSQDLNTCQTGNHDVVLKQKNGEIKKYKQDEVLREYYEGIVPARFSWGHLGGSYKNIYDTDFVHLCISVYLNGTMTHDGYISLEYTSMTLVDYTILLNKFSNIKRVTVVKDSVIDSGMGRILFKWNEYGDFLKYSEDSKRFLFNEELLSYTNDPKLFNDISVGCIKFGGYYFRVGTQEEADFLQMLLINYGVPYCIVTEGNYLYLREVESSKRSYSYSGKDVVVTEIKDKWKYCFCVPSHMLVLRRGGNVYVTGNCGFGGRMLGALSSKNNYKYVGTDPNVETMYHLNQLGEYIEEVTGRDNSYELHCCGSEDFRGKPNSIDFAFSSPPYFDLEVYSDDPTQCYNKFPVLEDWLEGYVRQTIKNIIYMLKPGRVYAVNIADFKVGGGGECAYVDEWIRISKEEGAPLFDNVYLGVTARAGSKEQAAGELKKENILIFKKPL